MSNCMKCIAQANLSVATLYKQWVQNYQSKLISSSLKKKKLVNGKFVDKLSFWLEQFWAYDIL